MAITKVTPIQLVAKLTIAAKDNPQLGVEIRELLVMAALTIERQREEIERLEDLNESLGQFKYKSDK